MTAYGVKQRASFMCGTLCPAPLEVHLLQPQPWWRPLHALEAERCQPKEIESGYLLGRGCQGFFSATLVDGTAHITFS